jgi:imidazolonepropionase-like amidohydrolase
VTIAFGTDMGVGPHGQSAREFGFMVEAGMRSREAIKAATVNAAKLLDLSDEVGTREAAHEHVAKLVQLRIRPFPAGVASGR